MRCRRFSATRGTTNNAFPAHIRRYACTRALRFTFTYHAFYYCGVSKQTEHVLYAILVWTDSSVPSMPPIYNAVLCLYTLALWFFCRRITFPHFLPPPVLTQFAFCHHYLHALHSLLLLISFLPFLCNHVGSLRSHYLSAFVACLRVRAPGCITCAFTPPYFAARFTATQQSTRHYSTGSLYQPRARCTASRLLPFCVPHFTPLPHAFNAVAYSRFGRRRAAVSRVTCSARRAPAHACGSWTFLAWRRAGLRVPLPFILQHSPGLDDIRVHTPFRCLRLSIHILVWFFFVPGFTSTAYYGLRPSFTAIFDSTSRCTPLAAFTWRTYNVLARTLLSATNLRLR